MESISKEDSMQHSTTENKSLASKPPLCFSHTHSPVVQVKEVRVPVVVVVARECV